MNGLNVWVLVVIALVLVAGTIPVYCACVLSSRISKATRGLYGDDDE